MPDSRLPPLMEQSISDTPTGVPGIRLPFRFVHTTLPSPSPVQQIDGLQALRAIAVILVAWFHTSEFCGYVIGRTLPSLGPYGIDIFFVISGFIMSTILLRATDPPEPWTFMKRRILRIFPVYWVFASLSAFILLQRHELFTRNYIPAFFLLPWTQYPSYPLLVGFSWTLVFEMIFYCLIFLVLLMKPRLAVPITIAVLLALVATGSVIDIRHPVLIALLNPLMLEFVFGCVIALLYKRFGPQRRFGFILLIIATAISFSLNHLPFPTADGMQMIVVNLHVVARVATWGLAAAAVVAGMVFWSPALDNPLGKLLLVLGNSSYSAYLASAVVVEGMTQVFLKLDPHPRSISLPAQVLLQVTFVIAILAVGWLSYQFIEWPLLHRLQRLTHNSKPG